MGLRDRLAGGVSAAGHLAQRAGEGALDTAKTAGREAAQLGGSAASRIGIGGDQAAPREVLLLIVQRARDGAEERQPQSRKDVERSYTWRLRFAGIAGWFGPLGSSADAATGLYTEAGVLADIAYVHGRQHSDEDLAAYLLVVWGLVGDVAGGRRALGGDLSEVASNLGDRARELTELRSVRGAAKTLKLLWQLRGGDVSGAPGLRDLDEMIDASERALGV